jgi:hypothetical protein
MDRESVTSSVLASVGFDADTDTLEIEFSSGDVYRYAGVPEFLYRGLMLSASKGVFFNTRIAGRYAFEHVPILDGPIFPGSGD